MSHSPIPCRLLLDLEPRAGDWNMAIDELLLEQAVDQGGCALRWYRWDQPTISLGHFQDPQSVTRLEGLASLPVVRRLSGGGAIVHDHELTYSCAIPAAHPLTEAPRALYTRVHQAIIDVLREVGVATRFRGKADASRAAEFLCFGRGDSFDVVIGSHKVLGSAQRRRKGAVLQHGSLIIGRSAAAPQFPGLNDLSGMPVDPESIAGRLAEAVGESLCVSLTPGSLTEEELERARSRTASVTIRIPSS